LGAVNLIKEVLAMTKDEILATIRNHKGDVAVALNNAEAVINSCILGQVPEDQQKAVVTSTLNMTTYTKNQLATINLAIKQWPEA